MSSCPTGLVSLSGPVWLDDEQWTEGTDVTEQQWMECTDPLRMLLFLRGKASDRKLRLFGCACCRRIWQLLPDQSNRDLVAAVEDHPNGTFADLGAAIISSSRREPELPHDLGFWAVKYLGRSFHKFTPLDAAEVVARCVAHRVGGTDNSAAELESQTGLLREIIGNPFHPLPPSPEAIAPLAQQVYQGRWDLIPILGEWLQEHGYWTEGEHCLDPDIRHVKGCWVVDWLLGKS
jgi:hypothetical protein